MRVGYTGGDIKNCTFSDIIIKESNRGVLVNVRDQYSVENLLFSNINIETRLHTGHWWGHGEPIQVSAVANERDSKKLGKIKNVRFLNIGSQSQSGIVVWGSENSIIEDLAFVNFSAKIKNSPLNAAYGGNFDLRTSGDFNTAMFKHDIPVIYCRNVKGLNIINFETEWEDGLPDFFNHSIWCENCDDVTIDGFAGRGAHLENKNDAAIFLDKINGLVIRNCQAAEGTNTFFKAIDITGPRLITNNELSKARQPFDPPDFK